MISGIVVTNHYFYYDLESSMPTRLIAFLLALVAGMPMVAGMPIGIPATHGAECTPLASMMFNGMLKFLDIISLFLPFLLFNMSQYITEHSIHQMSKGRS